MTYNKFNIPKFFRSFLYASKGIVNLLKTEQNARIHLIYAIIVAVFAYLLSISRIEATVLFFAVVLVIAMEITNTAIEKLLDIIKPESSSAAEFIKDAMAGAVLISALIALVVTVLTFLPHLNKLAI
ncbi:MAG: diacylglycerol kinase [Candidatus Berkelbacteria bacterium Athens1014_28]|uniref:Diacylglycerol kinase n=1 Tax=Candidatus Berkelbacteria bacterium Athens1014_28 TaxID=2017145 RepID=A0A554LN00_9BACT|nr:MAG: diacylglycerol kinase [Candidatus Berkelbacteria bacterium Athens1014_28]